MVKIGLSALHRRGLNTHAFCALLDNRWTTFTEALIGGVQTSLSDGPVSFDIYPNFSVSLSDANIMKILTLGVQTSGYDRFLGNSENLSIFYCTCVRFYNTTIPAVLHAPSNESGTVTLMQYDSSCNPLTPNTLSKYDLNPPSVWKTTWNNLHNQPKYLSNHCVKEAPGQVITQFKPNQSRLSLQHGEIRNENENEIEMVKIPRHLYESLKAGPTRPMTQLPMSTVPVHDRTLNRECSHPECNGIDCIRTPFGLNVLTIEKISERKPAKKYKNKGLGYIPVPQVRINLNNKITIPEKKLSLEELMFVERNKMGIGPFDRKDAKMKRLFCNDIITHPLSVKYNVSEKERIENGKKWISFMEKENKWVSLIEWYFGRLPEQKFPVGYKSLQKTVRNQIGKPMKRKSLCDLDSERRCLKCRRITETLAMMEAESEKEKEFESQPKESSHTWKKPSGEEIKSITDFPPWEDLQYSYKNNSFELRPLQKDSQHVDARMCLAGINWTNVAVDKGHEILRTQINRVGQEVKNVHRPIIRNIDSNVYAVSKKIDSMGKNLANETQIQAHNVIDKLESVEKKIVQLSIDTSKVQYDVGLTNTEVGMIQNRTEEVMIKAEEILEKIEKKKTIISHQNLLSYPQTAMHLSLPSSSQPSKTVQHPTIPKFKILPSLSLSEEELGKVNEYITFPEEEEESDPFRLDKLSENLRSNIPESGETSWKTAPDISQSAYHYPQKVWSSTDVTSWSLENKNETEILLMLEQMVIQYKTYMQGGTEAVAAVNMIIIGFEGRLLQWLLTIQKSDPEVLTKWSKVVVLNNNGTPRLLSDGSQENNFIGKLTSEIHAEFIGAKVDHIAIQTLALNKMKLKNMEHFEEYYEEHIRRVFQMDNPSSSHWKSHFVSTLPTWFAKKMVDAIKNFEGKSWGLIKQSAQAIIINLCEDQKQIKRVVQRKEKYLISPLCKKYHLDAFQTRESALKSRGAWNNRKKKKKVKKFVHTGRKLYRHKRGMQWKGPSSYRRSSKRKPTNQPGQPQRISCYRCGGKHYMSQCPQLPKKVKQEVHKLEEQLKQISLSAADEEKSQRSESEEEEQISASDAEGKNSDSSYEVLEINESSTDSCSCSSSDCECLSVLTIDEENELLTAMLSTKDRRTRETIAKTLEERKKDGYQHKDKQKVIPESFMFASFERNSRQFSDSSVLENEENLKDRITQLEHRVSILEMEQMPPLEDLTPKSEKGKNKTEPFQFGRINEENLFAIKIQCPIIRMQFTIAGTEQVLSVLLDTGSGINAIRGELAPYHHRIPSSVAAVKTINEKEKIESEIKVLALLSKETGKRMELSCAIISSLTNDVYLGQPFLTMVKPYGFKDVRGKEHFFYTVNKKMILSPLISSKRNTYQVNRIKEQLKELKDSRTSLSMEKLMNREDYQKKIERIKEGFKDLSGSHPGKFWNKKKYFADLPFKEGYIEKAHRSKAIPMTEEQKKLCYEEIEDLLKKGLIRKSRSPWACFGFYVNKHSEIVRGKPRLVINFKPLNDCLAYDSYPLPKPSDLLAKIKKARIFSKFDLKSGFWQIQIREEDRYKTGFTVPRGHFEWNVMPFGLKNAPSVFQRMMDEVFKDCDTFIQTYIDDVLVFSENLDDHVKHLRIFHQKIKDNGLVLSDTKCKLFQLKIDFLGYELHAGHFSPMGHSLEFVDKFPDKILDKKQLQRFLGCLNYVSHFFKECAQNRKLLNKRLKKEPEPWTEACTEAVKAIKKKVKELPLLHLFREEWVTEVYSDASDDGWGAALVQFDPGEEKPQKQICRFASGTWEGAQKNWDINKKELSAILHAVRKFHDFIAWQKFNIFCDNKAVADLYKKQDTKVAVIARWLMELASYDCEIHHIPGEKNSVADMLSREYLAHNPQDQEAELNVLQIQEIENCSWQHWERIWTPEQETRFRVHGWISTDETYSYKRVRSNLDALRSLGYLQDCGFIDYMFVSNFGCIVQVQKFPMNLDEDYEGLWNRMFMYQNPEYNFFYICLMDTFINPVSQWQLRWLERYGLSPLSCHPRQVYRQLYGRPADVEDALQHYKPVDYHYDIDWIVRMKVKQRKIGGPPPIPEERRIPGPWNDMADALQRSNVEPFLEERDSCGKYVYQFEQEISFTVQYFHERFDWAECLFSDAIVQKWEEYMANPESYLLYKPPLLDHAFNPRHQDISHISDRYLYYCSTLSALSINYGDPEDIDLIFSPSGSPTESEYVDSDRSPKGPW